MAGFPGLGGRLRQTTQPVNAAIGLRGAPQLLLGMLSGYHGAVRASESAKRGRRAVILAGVTTAMVLVVGLLRWKDVLARYHLIRLRADPDYLGTATLEPEESLARAGLRLYLTTEEGKDRLARAYLDACEDWTDWPTEVKDLSLEVDAIQISPSDRLDRFIRSVAPFLGLLRGRSFRPERHPEFQVTFLSADEAGSRTGWYFVVGEDGVFSIEHAGRPGLGAGFNTVTGFLIEPVTTSP